VKDQQIGIRLSIATELNPASFKIFDVVLLILIRLAEEADRLSTSLAINSVLATNLLTLIKQWLGTQEVKRTEASSAGAGAEVGVGIKGGSFWADLLGLSAAVKSEIKYAAERKTESVEYRFRRLPECLDYCGRQRVTFRRWNFTFRELSRNRQAPGAIARE
jgi:hypothetical protein